MVVPPDLDWLADVICPQCEGGGEVVPHGDVDCDICVRGEYEGHTIPCPTCGGLGEGLFMPSSLVGSGGRLVVETPCEHGVFHDSCDQLVCGHDHLLTDGWYPDARAECWCPGGSRRVVWPTDKEEGSAENKVSAETQRDLYACPLSCECEGGEE